MRIDVDIAKEMGVLGKVKVFLNEQPIRQVVVADEEQGLIERYKQEGGKFVIDREQGVAVRETLHGKVKIVIGV